MIKNNKDKVVMPEVGMNVEYSVNGQHFPGKVTWVSCSKDAGIIDRIRYFQAKELVNIGNERIILNKEFR